ncbi:Quinoprotein glucose dehydrogenase B precursor [Lacunisphaera limnophila]|uniref:Quinoprotein glucose dehydrogenase B n=1 Tax=Lacunisphaera limnophila TaxID=1838286 RepID=A0A1D8B009_9BACT|nr:PQQ-dependent sugar dehydrogenase [Lacunisphaera limnophila]AOS46457.1 Quinoprotein glucose dehydrogenase B precursor [Lacunisphaera limnophila]
MPPPRLHPRLVPLCLLLGAAAPAFATPPPAPLSHLQLTATTLAVDQVATGFDSPIDLAWGPDNHLWCTQLDGSVWRIDPASGERQEVLRLAGVFHRKSHGLQSLAFHPQFATAPYVYLHYVYQLPARGLDEVVRSRVVRCRWDGSRLGDPETLVNDLPGRAYHNGSRLLFGPDEKLYLTTGDAGHTQASLDPAALSGKVLRFNPDGTIPADNPFPGSPVWTLGHRNSQGLAFGRDGRLYATEHGPNNDDEVNLLVAGHNYGWPVIEGFIDQPAEIEAARGRSFTEPLRAWTPTIAAAGLAYYDHPAIPELRHTLLVANLKGRALRVLALDAAGEAITGEHIYLQQRLGRLRDVCVSPAGDIYLLTSNTDWHPRFQPWMYDALPAGPDRILRLHPTPSAPPPQTPVWSEDLEPLKLLSENWALPATTEALKAGQDLYTLHCLSCHGPTGQGAPGLIPPLAQIAWVTGDKNRLIQVVLAGLNGRIEVNGAFYEQEMPAFRHLPDADLAAVLTYIRASFGNQAGAVVPAEVAEERKGLR